MSEEKTLLNFLDEIKETAYERMGLNETDSDKFNFATISKTEGGIDYIEYWLLINAYYDETLERFIKIDGTSTSFGIQMQAKGTYPGEQSLGYMNNSGINIWRNPKKSEVYKDTTNYNYTDFDNNNHIGAKKRSNNEWVTFGIGTGWINNFMTDSYGGMTIGGAGIEVDGNNIFPYARLTSSRYNDGTNNYYLLGILENAYHPSGSDWECDNNTKYAWFFGFKYPEKTGAKDGENGKFIVMYNDMHSINPSASGYTIEDMNISDWKVILEVGKTGTKAIVDGVLATLGTGGGAGDVVDEVTDEDMHAVTSNAVYNALLLKEDVEDAFSGDYEDLTNKPDIPEEVSDLSDGSDVLMKSLTAGLVKNDGTIDTNQYLTQHQSLNSKTVTLTKQSTPETGYAATYVLKQGGTALSPKINIPKDFLVRSATVETCTTDNVPVQGYVVGDKYLDFVVNSVDNDATASHIYLKVTELVDVYSADNVTLELGAGNVFKIKDGGVTYAKINSSAIGTGASQIAAGNHTHGNIDNGGILKISGTAQADKNVVTDSNGKIITEAKPTIPTVVDVVADGNANAVSSNAVYDYIASIIGDIDTWLVS